MKSKHGDKKTHVFTCLFFLNDYTELNKMKIIYLKVVS